MFRSEASERHGGGGGADHRSLLVSASSEQTEARISSLRAQGCNFRTLFQNFEHSDHLLGRPSKFSQIDSFACNYKNDLLFSVWSPDPLYRPLSMLGSILLLYGQWTFLVSSMWPLELVSHNVPNFKNLLVTYCQKNFINSKLTVITLPLSSHFCTNAVQIFESKFCSNWALLKKLCVPDCLFSLNLAFLATRS